MSTVTPASEQVPKRTFWRSFWQKYLRPAVMLTLLLTPLTGIIYPGVVTGLAQLLFPYQANGSLHYVNGKLVGSDLIGQYWTFPKYFHGRPSATVNLNGTPSPYEADNSSASNLGPTNATLIKSVQQRVADLKKENPNAPAGPVPVDLVMTHVQGRFLGIFGEPYVNVLDLNLALDALK